MNSRCGDGESASDTLAHTMWAPKQLLAVAVAVAVAALLILAPASSQVVAQPQSQRLRLGTAVDRLTVLHDGVGHYFALEEGGNFATFYYGDGKTFYRQHVSSFAHTAETRSLNFWAPGVSTRGRRGGELGKDELGQWTVTCKDEPSLLEPLPISARDELVKSAIFRVGKWQRRVRFAARDEEGRYYIVDSERDSYERGWRLFVGKRGKLKELHLVDVVSDSGGDVFATTIGDLSFERREMTRAAVWSQGKQSESLTFVPPELNAQLFYFDMGLYSGGLGTPCDFF